MQNKPTAIAKARNLVISTIVGHIRLSVPVLWVTAVDTAVHQLFLSEMVQQIVNEGGPLVLPRGVRVLPVDKEKLAIYQDELSGLTAENMSKVKGKLVELGISTGPAAPVE